MDPPSRREEICVEEGYAALTVSPSQVPKVKQYIAKQLAHHRSKAFEDEYVELLRLAGVPFDGRYLW
jgi:REP-associated tyrosine transposase